MESWSESSFPVYVTWKPSALTKEFFFNPSNKIVVRYFKKASTYLIRIFIFSSGYFEGRGRYGRITLRRILGRWVVKMVCGWKWLVMVSIGVGALGPVTTVLIRIFMRECGGNVSSYCQVRWADRFSPLYSAVIDGSLARWRVQMEVPDRHDTLCHVVDVLLVWRVIRLDLYWLWHLSCFAPDFPSLIMRSEYKNVA